MCMEMSASCIPDCENNETKIDRNLRITSFEMGNVLFLARRTYVSFCNFMFTQLATKTIRCIYSCNLTEIN